MSEKNKGAERPYQTYQRVKTTPWGIPIVPLPKETQETGAEFAERIHAASQVSEDGSLQEMQRKEAISFVEKLLFTKSKEEVEEWFVRNVSIDQDGTIKINSNANNIEEAAEKVEFPKRLALNGHLAIWPQIKEIHTGEYTYIAGNLVIIGGTNIVFHDSDDFFVKGDVSVSKTTPKSVVKKLVRLKNAGKIKGELKEI